MNFEKPTKAFKTERKNIIEPEKLKELTKFKFNEEGWKSMMTDAIPYDPDKVFYGIPGKDAHLKSGAHGEIMFRDVYDESGCRIGGIITGYPIKNEENPNLSEMLEKERRKLKKAIELLRKNGIEISEGDLDKE